MRFKLLWGNVLVLMMAAAAGRAGAQASYAASSDNTRLSFGGGFAAYNPDWGGQYTYGYAAVVDWHPPILRGPLNDFKIEGEFRGLAFGEGEYGPNHHAARPTLYTAGGGLLYQPGRARFFHSRFAPYVKGVGSWGSISWYAPEAIWHGYDHDTRGVWALGGGLDYRINHHFTARVDYEYQWWPQLFGPNSLDPHGFTAEGLYNFDLRHRRRF